jgi:hypothetical protein
MRALFGLAFLAACMGSKFEPTTVKAPPDAFDRAVRVLTEQGNTIEMKDESAGILLTKWEDSERLGTKVRVRWKVTISNGNATVDSQCQNFLKTSPLSTGNWEDCANQPDARTEGAKKIGEAIAR